MSETAENSTGSTPKDTASVKQVTEPTTHIPEPLSGHETAALIEELYNLAGPRVGAALVEANIVLTVAGARGQTEYFIRNPSEEDRGVIKKLDEVLKTRGMSMHTVGEAIKRPKIPFQNS